VTSRFGSLRQGRPYGWCDRCQTWQFPADHALGLAKNAPASPYLQEISALLVSKMPPEQAVAAAERLGLELSRCTLDREAHHQGLKAQALRAQSVADLDTWEGRQTLSRHTEGPAPQPFTLVIEIAAWNVRERDQWGQTKTLPAPRPAALPLALGLPGDRLPPGPPGPNRRPEGGPDAPPRSWLNGTGENWQPASSLVQWAGERD
jgi:hypothetical protein